MHAPRHADSQPPSTAAGSPPPTTTTSPQPTPVNHAFQRLFAQVYGELRALAQRRMNDERPGHTLHATELVHEVYLRLFADDGPRIDYANRAHFFHAVGEAMRRILIDHARRRAAHKRGGGDGTGGTGARPQRVSLTLLDAALPVGALDLLTLDEAFVQLETKDARAAEVVRLRYFAGLTIEQTADAMGLSPRTVKREWEFARAWLLKWLQ